MDVNSSITTFLTKVEREEQAKYQQSLQHQRYIFLKKINGGGDGGEGWVKGFVFKTSNMILL